jgi:hypothetical protein
VKLCEKKNCRKKKTSEPPNRWTGRFYSGSAPVRAFFSGSLAERFCVLTGPDSSPIPGTTDPTGRSGFDNLALHNHAYNLFILLLFLYGIYITCPLSHHIYLFLYGGMES